MKTLLRIIVIGAILLILVFLSIGIVKIVPKALSSLASATVSIGSLFGGNASSTDVTNSNGSNGTVVQNGNGFIVVGTSTDNGANTGNSNSSIGGTKTASSTCLLDLITPKFGSYPYNNYVPTPAGQTSKNGTSTQSGSNSSSNASNGGSSARVTSRTCVAGEQPDLAVSILSRGIINASGQYIETNNFTTGDTVSLKFKIENRGICSTGAWNFKAEMPSTNTVDQVRTVSNVASLPAGSAVTGQANFDSPRSGSSNVVLTVTDTTGRDSNTSNNVATSALSVTNSGTTNGGNGNNGGVITSGDGRPDLNVRILQTGVLTYNNQFVPMSTINGNNGAFGGNFRSADRVAVQFEIDNQGLSATGAWNFQAQFTGSNYPARIYNNPSYEASIPAGGRAIYTIAFDNIQFGSNSISIFTDNLNQVNEFNEGNNTASVYFNVSY